MAIQRYRPSDYEQLAELFYQMVHTVNASGYTKEQLAVWASGCVKVEEWNQSFIEYQMIAAAKIM